MKTATRQVHDPCANTDARGPCDTGTLERPRYFPRQLVTAADLSLEHEYLRDKLRRHNRLMHGWGVVCGAEVCVVRGKDGPGTEPWTVRIRPGYILGPYGDEIVIDRERRFDVRSGGLVGSPGEPATDATDPWCSDVFVDRELGEIYIAVRYQEVMARPVRVEPIGCGCGDNPCEYSRWRECYEIGVLPSCPESHRPPPAPQLFAGTEVGSGARGEYGPHVGADKRRATETTLWGEIRDTSGTTIPGAYVEITGPAGQRFSGVTDAEGRYMITGITPGPYRASVNARGYAELMQSVTVAEGTTEHRFVVGGVGGLPRPDAPPLEIPRDELPRYPQSPEIPRRPIPRSERTLPTQVPYPMVECLPCPDDPWVVLAKVSLEANGRVTSIDNCSCRRLVPSQAYIWGVCQGSVAVVESVKAPELEPGRKGIQIEVRGSNLNPRNAADIDLGEGITVVTVEGSGTTLKVTVDVAANATPGSRTLMVGSGDCAPSAVREDAVNIKRAPVTPDTARPSRAPRRDAGRHESHE